MYAALARKLFDSTAYFGNRNAVLTLYHCSDEVRAEYNALPKAKRAYTLGIVRKLIREAIASESYPNVGNFHYDIDANAFVPVVK